MMRSSQRSIHAALIYHTHMKHAPPPYLETGVATDRQCEYNNWLVARVNALKLCDKSGVGNKFKFDRL